MNSSDRGYDGGDEGGCECECEHESDYIDYLPHFGTFGQDCGGVFLTYNLFQSTVTKNG